jgi:hypothetical protein
MVAFRADGLTARAVGGFTVPIGYETEIYDLQDGLPANNYDPVASVFTAPLAGTYRFAANLNGQTSAGTPTVTFSIVTSNVTQPPGNSQFTAFMVPAVPGVFPRYSASVDVDFLLDAGDTVSVTMTGTDGSTFVSLGPPVVQRAFSGSLIELSP